MIAVMLMGVASITVFADDEIDYSFYKLSSDAAECFSRKLAPTDDKAAGVLKANEDEQDKVTVVLQGGGSLSNESKLGQGIDAAGNYLAFAESSKDGGWLGGWILSLLSSSSSTYSYDIFDNITIEGSTNSKAFLHYCAYGSLLETIGIDKTSTEGFNFLRIIAGGLMLLAYSVALFVDSVFIFVVKVLKMLNPFQLFSLVRVSSLGYSDSGMFTNDGKWVIDQNNFLYPVASVLSRLYETIHNFSWVVIVPIFFALAIFSAIIVVNRGQRHYMGRPTGMYDVVKKLFIRLLFLVVGVPLLGSTYSAALDGIEGALSGDQKGTFAAKVIASTFVDFESWAANTNLNPPNDAVLYTSIMKDGNGHVTFRPASGSYSSLRTTCLAINKSTGILKSAFSGFSVTENTDAGTDASLSYNTDNSYQSGLAKNGEAKYKSHSRSMSETEVVYDILNRYTQSYFYHASDYETNRKATYGQSDSKAWQEWFKYLKKWDCWDDAKPFNDAEMQKACDAVLFNGSARCVESNSAGYSHDSTGMGHLYGFWNTSDTGKGLSDLSMYNYLSSDFSASSLKCYSNLKSSSGFVRQSHYSVNLIGSGILPALYWFNSMTMLICYAVIGIGYAFAMLINNIMRTVRSITALPFAMLGSMPAIAKSITYVLIMILEVVVTLFAYALVSDFLFTITSLVESLLTQAIGAIFGTITPGNNTLSIVAATPVVVAIVLIVQIIFIIWFTKKAMSVRKALVKSIDEAAGRLVDSLILANSGGSAFAPDGAIGGGKAGALVGGAAMGAAAGAASSGAKKDKGTRKGVLGGGMPVGGAPGGSGGIGSSGANGANGSNGSDGGGIGGFGGFGGTNDVINSGGVNADNSSDMSVNGGSSDMTNNMSMGEGAGAMGEGASAMGEGAGGQGGSTGAGQVASTMTAERYADNNAEQADKSEGEKMEQRMSLTGNTREKREENRDIKEAEKEQELRMAMGEGGGTTASADMDYDKNKMQAAAEAKKAAAEKMMQSGEQTVVGAAEVIGGAYSGDAGLVKDGVKNVDNGSLGMKSAQADSKNAGSTGAAQAMQQREAEAQQAEAAAANNNVSATYGGDSSSMSVNGGNSNSINNGGNQKVVDSDSSVDRSSAQVNEGGTQNTVDDKSKTDVKSTATVGSKGAKSSSAPGGNGEKGRASKSKTIGGQQGTPLRQKGKHTETRQEQHNARKTVAQNQRDGKTPGGAPKQQTRKPQARQQGSYHNDSTKHSNNGSQKTMSRANQSRRNTVTSQPSQNTQQQRGNTTKQRQVRQGRTQSNVNQANVNSQNAAQGTRNVNSQNAAQGTRNVNSQNAAQGTRNVQPSGNMGSSANISSK